MEVEKGLNDMADAIEKLAEVGEVIKKSRLKEKVVLLVLCNLTGLGQKDVKAVLDGLVDLKKACLK
jgi:hypothetical protein